MFRPRFIIIVLVTLLLFLFITGPVSITELWNLVLLEPILNFLILLSKYLLGSFGLAILALTVITRLLTLPLTFRQLHATKAMQELQPKVKELQRKYAKDKQKLGQETMKLYKELGVNPLGCAFPMLIQFPIWIALYQAIMQALAYIPENLLGLSARLYSWSAIQEMVPLNSHFLWLDLSRGDILVAILVAGSMWMLQKMSTMPSGDPTQQSMNRMMQWMMPFMLGFFALSFPSGLSVYWIASNIIGIVIQYRVTGWGSLTLPAIPALGAKRTQQVNIPAKISEKKKGPRGDIVPQQETTIEDTKDTERKEAIGSGATSKQRKEQQRKYRSKRKDRRRGRRTRFS